MQLAVANDGATEAKVTSSGGLDDLAKRLHAAGGTLTWQGSGRRFEVRATLPETTPERTLDGIRVGTAGGR